MSDFTLVRSNHHPRSVSVYSAQKKKLSACRTGVAQPCGIPSNCAAVLREALDGPGPALVEAVVDPNEPPLPPKVTFDQATKLVEALARGTPGAREIIRNIAMDKVREQV